MSETQTSTEKGGKHQMSFTVGDDGTIRADFGPGLDPLVLDPAKVPESLYPAIIAEGIISRARGYNSKLQGEDRTPAALRGATEKAFENFLQGIWKVERIGGGLVISIEAEAAFVFRQKRATLKGVTFDGTLEQSAADFAALSEEKKAVLKADKLYAVAYAEVKARRAAEKAAKLAEKAEASGDDVF